VGTGIGDPPPRGPFRTVTDRLIWISSSIAWVAERPNPQPRVHPRPM